MSSVKQMLEEELKAKLVVVVVVKTATDCKICGEEMMDDDEHDCMCIVCYKEEAYKEHEQRLRSFCLPLIYQ
jgi:hypothetical protein